MPSIRDSQKVNQKRLEPRGEIGGGTAPNVSFLPPMPAYGVSPYVQSSLPPITAGLDQNVRQFYDIRGPLPTLRIIPANAAPAPINGTTGPQGPTGPSGATGSAAKSVLPDRVDIPLHLAGAAQSTGTVPLGRTFTLLQVKLSASCRVRLYSTTAARSADLARNVSTLPTQFAQHGIIFDLNGASSLTFPLTWICSPEAPGSDMTGVGDIAYAVDNFNVATWTTLTNHVFSNCMATEIARYVTAPAAGTMFRFNAGFGLPSTDYTVYAVDSGGTILEVFGYYPNMAPTNTYVSGIVPVGAAKLVAWSGPTIGSCTDPTHFSTATVVFESPLTYSALDLTFTVLKQERGAN